MAKSIYMQITHCEKCSVELDWREECGGLQLGAEGVDAGVGPNTMVRNLHVYAK